MRLRSSVILCGACSIVAVLHVAATLITIGMSTSCRRLSACCWLLPRLRGRLCTLTGSRVAPDVMCCVDPARRFSERQELLHQVEMVVGFRLHTLALRCRCQLIALHAAMVP